MTEDNKKTNVLSLVGKRESKASEIDADKEDAVRAFGEKLIGEARKAIDAGIHGYMLVTIDRMGNPGITWHSGFNNQVPLMGALPVLTAQLVHEAIHGVNVEDPK